MALAGAQEEHRRRRLGAEAAEILGWAHRQADVAPLHAFGVERAHDPLRRLRRVAAESKTSR